MENRTFDVTDDCNGTRLDRFLTTTLPDHSRSYLQKLIDQGAVTVNGEAVKKKQALATGDRVRVEIPDERIAPLNPEDCDLDVLFEDDSILVIDKPPDMVVHPGAGNREGTLVNKLLGMNNEQFMAMMDEDERPGIVHRLDKKTSGVMVVAKTPTAKRRVAKQFEERRVKKSYLAIVKGRLPQSSDLRIETGITRHSVHRKKMTVCESGGRHAISIFNALDATANASLVEATILTGRMHQIRVHLTHLGCPILGDSLYGRAGGLAPRQMLHAWKLSILHPVTEEPMTFTAPPPADFLAVMQHQGLSLG